MLGLLFSSSSIKIEFVAYLLELASALLISIEIPLLYRLVVKLFYSCLGLAPEKFSWLVKVLFWFSVLGWLLFKGLIKFKVGSVSGFLVAVEFEFLFWLFSALVLFLSKSRGLDKLEIFGLFLGGKSKKKLLFCEFLGLCKKILSFR